LECTAVEDVTLHVFTVLSCLCISVTCFHTAIVELLQQQMLCCF